MSTLLTDSSAHGLTGRAASIYQLRVTGSQGKMPFRALNARAPLNQDPTRGQDFDGIFVNDK